MLESKFYRVRLNVAHPLGVLFLFCLKLLIGLFGSLACAAVLSLAVVLLLARVRMCTCVYI